MKRSAKPSSDLRWPPWVPIGAWLVLSIAHASLLPALDEVLLRHLGSAPPAALKRLEKSPEGVPVPSRSAAVARRTSCGSEGRIREASFPQGLVRDLLHRTSLNPRSGSPLEFCAEYTKPDSLKIRLMGTPKNHRSPPA
jgi:hypothetical protein